MNIYSVGDIIHPDLEPRNEWVILKLKGSIAKVHSLISDEERIIHLGRANLLEPFRDGRQYDYDTGTIYPPKYGKPIENVSDLFALAAHYRLKDI